MADPDLVKAESERVFELFGAQLRSFRRVLYVVIVTGLALFALLVVPYLTFRDGLAQLRIQDADLGLRIPDVEARLAQASKDADDLDELDRMFYDRYIEFDSDEGLFALARELPAHEEMLAELKARYDRETDPEIRAWVDGQRKLPPDALIATRRDINAMNNRACTWESGMTWIGCQTCEWLTGQTGRLGFLISKTGFARSAAVDYPAELDAVRGAACAAMTGQVEHWSLSGVMIDEVDIHELRGWLSQDVQAVLEVLDDAADAAKDRVPVITAELQALRDERATVRRELQILTEQVERISSFNSIGTPMGNLPIGLGQLVLLFPLALALAYVVLANSFARLADLQHAFAGLCRKRDAEGAVLGAAHVAVIAPLWVHRQDSLAVQAVKWAILLVPMALIGLNLLLIQQTGALAEEIPDDAALSPAVYMGLYGMSLVLACGALVYIWRASARPSS